MPKIQETYRIVSNKRVTANYWRLSFHAPLLAKKVLPGQFIHIRVSDGLEPFFRRPFSVCRSQRDVEIFYEVLGKGTEILSQKKKADTIDVLGPLGNAFAMPAPEIKHVVMIAGGIGVAPFFILSDFLKKRKDIEITLLYGARSKRHVFDMKEFKQNGCRIFVSTDDGSCRTKGRVSALFSKITSEPKETFLYTCGPRQMMKCVQEFAKKEGLAGQASCEEEMACGLGACLGCAIKTVNGYKTVCYDGPVFDLQEVILE